MTAIVENGFGCNDETFGGTSSPNNAVNIVVPADYRARSIAGPAEITLIDATVQGGAAAGNAAFMAGYYAVFVIKSSSPIVAPDGTPVKNSNSALKALGSAAYGRFMTPANGVPVNFPRGALTCIKGEYLHVICTFVTDNANASQNTRISLGVYGNALNSDGPTKHYTAR